MEEHFSSHKKSKELGFLDPTDSAWLLTPNPWWNFLTDSLRLPPGSDNIGVVCLIISTTPLGKLTDQARKGSPIRRDNPTANPHGDSDRMRYDGKCIPGEASTVLPTGDRMHADDQEYIEASKGSQTRGDRQGI